MFTPGSFTNNRGSGIDAWHNKAVMKIHQNTLSNIFKLQEKFFILNPKNINRNNLIFLMES